MQLTDHFNKYYIELRVSTLPVELNKHCLLDEFKQLALLVRKVAKRAYLFEGEIEFKQRFAHESSSTMFDALNELIPSYFEPTKLVFVDAYDQPVHYVHKVTIDNECYFMDAYGLHSELSNIKARYGRNLVANIHPLGEVPSGELDASVCSSEAPNKSEAFNVNLVRILLANIFTSNSAR